MKNSKLRRVLLLLACAVLLVSLSVGATLAYLTSTTGVVENTFTVGKVKIELDEADVDQYGEPQAGAARVQKNEYKLVPAHTYVKDPTVYVLADSEPCYVYVEVINNIKAIEADADDKVENDPDTDIDESAYYTIAAQMEQLGWIQIGGPYWVKDEIVQTSAEVTELLVFESFTLSADADLKADMETVKNEDGSMTGAFVTIKAYAVQADGFAADTADFEEYEAINAWDSVFAN